MQKSERRRSNKSSPWIGDGRWRKEYYSRSSIHLGHRVRWDWRNPRDRWRSFSDQSLEIQTNKESNEEREGEKLAFTRIAPVMIISFNAARPGSDISFCREFSKFGRYIVQTVVGIPSVLTCSNIWIYSYKNQPFQGRWNRIFSTDFLKFLSDLIQYNRSFSDIRHRLIQTLHMRQSIIASWRSTETNLLLVMNPCHSTDRNK